jgi:glutathionylspermidine amidase/synthetase
MISSVVLFNSILKKLSNLSFGQIQGKTKNGIIIYSCYNPTSHHNNYINDIYSGIRWQCVEFARRYLIVIRNITFNNIDNAYQIFDLGHFKTLNNDPIKIYKNKNGSHNKPKIDDLIIWSYDVCNKKTGHVAVIVDVDDKYIYIAEQNWSFEKMEFNYNRKLKLKYKKGWTIEDKHIIGWISY